jgi:hypothetical protein
LGIIFIKEFNTCGTDFEMTYEFLNVSEKKIAMYGTRVSYEKPTKESKSSKMPWQHRGGPGRDHKVLMELQMNKVKCAAAELQLFTSLL